jgi:hypothetical protein
MDVGLGSALWSKCTDTAVFYKLVQFCRVGRVVVSKQKEVGNSFNCTVYRAPALCPPRCWPYGPLRVLGGGRRRQACVPRAVCAALCLPRCWPYGPLRGLPPYNPRAFFLSPAAAFLSSWAYLFCSTLPAFSRFTCTAARHASPLCSFVFPRYGSVWCSKGDLHVVHEVDVLIVIVIIVPMAAAATPVIEGKRLQELLLLDALLLLFSSKSLLLLLLLQLLLLKLLRVLGSIFFIDASLPDPFHRGGGGVALVALGALGLFNIRIVELVRV